MSPRCCISPYAASHTLPASAFVNLSCYNSVTLLIWFVPLNCSLVYKSIEAAFPRILFQFAFLESSKHCASGLACRSLWHSGLWSPIHQLRVIDKTTSWTNKMQRNISWWVSIESMASNFARKAVTAHGLPHYIVEIRCDAIFSPVTSLCMV